MLDSTEQSKSSTSFPAATAASGQTNDPGASPAEAVDHRVKYLISEVARLKRISPIAAKDFIDGESCPNLFEFLKSHKSICAMQGLAPLSAMQSVSRSFDFQNFFSDGKN